MTGKKNQESVNRETGPRFRGSGMKNVEEGKQNGVSSDPVDAALRHKVAKIHPNPTFVNRLSARLRAHRAAQGPAPRRVPLWGWASAAVALVFVFVFVIRTLGPDISIPAQETDIAQAPEQTATRPPVETETPSGAATEVPAPTETALPTPEPEPAFAADLPPVVATAVPRPGEEVNTQAGILLQFTQPMNRASVEEALRLSPPVEGTFAWEDERTVTFKPKALASGVRYQVSVGVGAQANNGLPLTHELAFTFSTIGPLTVSHTTPADQAADLRGDAPVLVAFNYPLVPVHCTGQVADAAAGCPELPLTLSPAVVGQGMWINTSVYRFDPVPGWQAGVTYIAEVPAGMGALNGATLDAAVSWTFTTAPPEVLRVEPEPWATNVPPDTAVHVHFNTPMDAATTEAAFDLMGPEGEDVPGTFTWEDNNARLVFSPTQHLALGSEYTVRVDTSAQSVNATPLASESQNTFVTAPMPGVVRIVGQNETQPGQVLEYYESLSVELKGLIDTESVPDHVRVTENGEALDITPFVNPHDGLIYVQINLWNRKTPGAEYCVTISPGIADRYGNTITEERQACFLAGDMPAIFIPALSQDTLALDAAEAARLYCVGVNVSQADFTLSKVSERDFTGHEQVSLGEVMRQWALTIPGTANVSHVLPIDLAEDGAPLPTGYYRLVWRAHGDQNRRQTSLRFAVVDRHLTLKMSADEALVWVTDLRTAQPVPGADVRLLNISGNIVGTGVTDIDGVARFTIPPQRERWDNYLAVTGAPGQPGFGVARKDWSGGVSPWNFDIRADYAPPSAYQVYVQTDRPIYRPDQTVHIRGILRRDEDARYSLPLEPQQLTLTMRDSNWDTVTSTTLTTNDMGTFSTDFELSPEARLGGYYVEARLVEDPDRSWGVSFTVAAYRKPEFEVQVLPEQADVFDGDTTRTLIAARYYAGGATAGARVHWTLRAKPFVFQPDVSGWWTWQSGDFWWPWWRDGQVLAGGEATLDEEGRYLLEMPADLEKLDEEDGDLRSQVWTLEATVTDEAGFPVTQESTFNVHTTRFYLGLRPESWVAMAGQAAPVNVLALDWDEHPVVEQEVSLSLARRTWRMIPSQEPYGAPRWEHTDTVVSTLNITTDAQGTAVAEITPPESGSYVVLAESTDAAGRIVHSETYLWVSGPEAAAWQQPESQVKPVADANTYRPGDVARILLPTSFAAPYEVLMTVERAGILDVRRFTAGEANPMIELPITAEHVPNIIVSFIAVKAAGPDSPPDVRVGMVELEVEPVEQNLTVEVIPDCSTDAIENCVYEPGDTASLTIRTLDHNGAPVLAEVALAVVDKAVLALADPNTPNLLKAFYQSRPLGVATGDGLLALFNRKMGDLDGLVAQTAERLVKEAVLGGIGGGGGGDGMYVADVRQDYPDTALWRAHLRTDADGEAHVSLELPDSLTTWVADARAVTEDTQVGQTTVEFIVSKPFYLRPVTPRFFVVGDQGEVAAVVHNNTEADLDVQVKLETNLQINGSADQQVQIPTRGRVRVAWEVQVPATGITQADLVFVAEGGGYRDAARPTVGEQTGHTLPIYRYETPEAFGTGGALTEVGSRLEAIVIPPDAGPDSYLTLRLEPTLAAGMTEGLKYLKHFPHECTEQLVSRFLPNVVTYRALEDLGMPNSDLEANLRVQVADALDRIYTRQMEDGSWSWWLERADFQVSAYATLGLIHAQRAGFSVREESLERAMGYLQRSLDIGLKSEARTLPQAFALYVLAEAGATWPEGADAALFDARTQLDVTGRAYLALALGLKDPEDPRVTTLLESLRADAEITANGAHWESMTAEYWITWTRATSIVLDALARLAPEDPLLPQAIRWLMIARKADRWETTQETTWAVIALTDAMVATGELQADYAWGVALNAEPLDEGHVTPETLREPVEYVIPVSDLLREWPNALEVSRGEGAGTLYYTADLFIYRPVDTLQAESRGMTIERQYCAVEGTLSSTPWSTEFEPCTPISSAKPGDLVEVRLTLTLPRSRAYLLVEDFYPAGMEPVDPTLNTESQEGTAPETRRVNTGQIWWWPSFDHQELRDERAVFYASHLSAGTYQVRYYVRATLPGTYHVIPATASQMYLPEVWGRSAGERFVVSP